MADARRVYDDERISLQQQIAIVRVLIQDVLVPYERPAPPSKRAKPSRDEIYLAALYDQLELLDTNFALFSRLVAAKASARDALEVEA